MWFVYFKHSLNWYGYREQTADMIAVEAKTIAAAKKEAKRWVRENLFKDNCENHVTVLKVEEA